MSAALHIVQRICVCATHSTNSVIIENTWLLLTDFGFFPHWIHLDTTFFLSDLQFWSYHTYIFTFSWILFSYEVTDLHWSFKDEVFVISVATRQGKIVEITQTEQPVQ